MAKLNNTQINYNQKESKIQKISKQNDKNMMLKKPILKLENNPTHEQLIKNSKIVENFLRSYYSFGKPTTGDTEAKFIGRDGNLLADVEGHDTTHQQIIATVLKELKERGQFDGKIYENDDDVSEEDMDKFMTNTGLIRFQDNNLDYIGYGPFYIIDATRPITIYQLKAIQQLLKDNPQMHIEYDLKINSKKSLSGEDLRNFMNDIRLNNWIEQ